MQKTKRGVAVGIALAATLTVTALSHTAAAASTAHRTAAPQASQLIAHDAGVVRAAAAPRKYKERFCNTTSNAEILSVGVGTVIGKYSNGGLTEPGYCDLFPKSEGADLYIHIQKPATKQFKTLSNRKVKSCDSEVVVSGSYENPVVTHRCAPAATVAACSAGSMCTWQDAGYTNWYTDLAHHFGGVESPIFPENAPAPVYGDGAGDLSTHGLNDSISSVWNRTNQKWCFGEHALSHGKRMSLAPGDRISNLGDRGWNDMITSVRPCT
ncbi:hypothetical protein Kisp01_72520 [Kineosporia sp. NBRC 101677]|uniref:peptidase inhibitor family I36 protein n=1 Tax=Kineosporia sp. NBRC 101677 TaxID=3032197 RepID=UPI0024A44182|nr:peptidase inhibitor family I36 protein [Kineosporia sp. NBRC 101677]GLY20238.1 hypothetical protein Kisp01_72520 [Kineosporia sp. NBRC 101677]